MLSVSVLGVLGMWLPVAEASGAEQTAAAPPVRVQGRTLDEWADVMKRVDPQGTVDAEVVRGLRTLMNDSRMSGIVRRQAATTLGRIGPAASAAVDDLQQILRSTDELETRLWALKSLSLFGAEAAPATTEILRVLERSDAVFVERAGAIDALSQIGIAHSATVPALIQLAATRPTGAVSGGYEFDQQRVLALESLTLIGAPAAASIPTLMDCTRDAPERVRRAAIVALGTMGTEAAVAVPALWDSAADDPSEAVRDEAVRALAAVGTRAHTVLLELARDDDPSMRTRVLKVLPQIESPPAALEQVVRTSLADTSPDVRLAAADTLLRRDSTDHEAISVVMKLLGEADRQVRLAAAELIVEHAGGSQKVRQELARLSESAEPAVRQAAQRTLKKLEPRSR